MKYSNELNFLRLVHPDLFNCTLPDGLRNTAELAYELETLLAGVKKLRKSYVMRALHAEGLPPSADLILEGEASAMRRFSESLRSGEYVPRKGATVTATGKHDAALPPTMNGTPVIPRGNEVRELPPDPEMDALLDKYLGDN